MTDQHSMQSPSSALEREPEYAMTTTLNRDSSGPLIARISHAHDPIGVVQPSLPHRNNAETPRFLREPLPLRSDSIGERSPLAVAGAVSAEEGAIKEDLDLSGAKKLREKLPCIHVSSNLRSSLWHCACTTQSNPQFADSIMNDPTTELRAGVVQKPFTVRTQALVSASHYFAALTDPSANKIAFPTKAIVNPDGEATSGEPDDEHHDRAALFAPIPTQSEFRVSGPFFFPDIDEFSFELFVDWLDGKELPGPNDFHSMTHYIVLYIIAQRFQIESLENRAIDLIRGYYLRNNMTASAFRLEFTYRNTEGPCLLRDFFVNTAVFRALEDHSSQADPPPRVSTAIRNTLRRGGDLAADYAVTLAGWKIGAGRDVRRDETCVWHIHKKTAKCSG